MSVCLPLGHKHEPDKTYEPIEMPFGMLTRVRPSKKSKVSPYSITERRVPGLIPVLGSQSAGDVSHKPGDRLPLLSARPAVTPATIKRFCCFGNRGTMSVNSLPKTVTRQCRDCDLNPGSSAPESSKLTTRLQSYSKPQRTIY